MVSLTLIDQPKHHSDFKFGFEAKELPIAEPTASQTLVKVQAAAFNHRDLWILRNMYPGIVMGSTLGSDGVGIVVKNGSQSSSFEVGQRVLINPGVNWESDERGPEGDFKILGLLPAIGTFSESLVTESRELVPCPEHLSTAEAAALPLAGLTAYRALFTKGKVKKGDYVLITGIGGGVALFAMQFAVAVGAHVYVSSGSQEKIEQAKALGAEGGINYKDPKCIAELKKMLNGNQISAIIDGAGGPLYTQYPKVMRTGGIIVNYGQTAGVEGVSFTMGHVIKNIDLCGSTMGSRREFQEMVAFVDKHKIKPVVSRVWQGLTNENVAEAIEMMKNHQQFGKVVIEINGSASPQLHKL
ncbi:uncharacterized protein BYT42DRAFT_554419 [Radiomyces spectabilis]|uniref:uncharacterized protein n=1 Tax=Radiomyces spectabilis TaxID=64574 RepID=UPI0022211F30|nr:uncharacterized protein BYT42DRAFT_554419 [Radiomyces spectabilis]KAI8390812.1 hypothetical protein BYT42DRAFT_554419 [Radiomyces spectabilis]